LRLKGDDRIALAEAHIAVFAAEIRIGAVRSCADVGSTIGVESNQDGYGDAVVQRGLALEVDANFLTETPASSPVVPQAANTRFGGVLTGKINCSLVAADKNASRSAEVAGKSELDPAVR